MNVPPPPFSASTAEKSSSTIGAFRTVTIIAVSAAAILLVIALGTKIEQLLLGWIYFPLSAIPKMTVNWPSVFAGSIGLVLFVVGAHRTACWLTSSASGNNSGKVAVWKWRSTLLATTVFLLLFVSGIALVGASHQFIWLLSGRPAAITEAVAPSQLGILAKGRAMAQRRQAANNLTQLGIAFHNFHNTHNAFPPGGTMNQDGELLHGWAMLIGPYHNFVAPDLDYNRGWRSVPNDRFYKCQIREFLNPCQPGAVFDAEGFGICHWAGNVHVLSIRPVSADGSASVEGQQSNDKQPGGIEHGVSMQQITDGTSTTILLGTAGANFKPWGHPANVRDPAIGINRSPDGFGGPPGWDGAMFLMCDGSVSFLSDETDVSVMKALATPAGGEKIPVPAEF